MRKLALIGGIGYLIIFITGIYANFNVLESLRGEEMLETYHNLKNEQGLFWSGALSFVLMVLADLLLTFILFAVFRLADPKRNALAAFFRLVNVVFFAVALFYLFDVQHYLNIRADGPITEMNAAYMVDHALSMFDTIWLIGLLFFGAHLLLLSKVICNSKLTHKSIPALLFFAGVGYIVDSCLQLFYSEYASIAHISSMIVVLPGLIGELSLTFWLLSKGGKPKDICLHSM